MARICSKKSRRKKIPKNMPKALKHVHLNAAGIDIGSESHFVAVPADRSSEPVREFKAFTGDLHKLADWLEACGIDTVAMESTGVYWIPLFELLGERGLKVYLVDPRHLKSVAARKTDVLDCQWLQELHTYGLLKPAFVPDNKIGVLRSFLRQRSMLVRYAADHIQHMQKALDQMNIKLHKVVSDISGVTGMRILHAILSGERDPKVLAQLRDNRCKNSEETIAKSLEGNWREDHLFELQQAVELYEFYQEKIAAVDNKMEEYLSGFDDKGDMDAYKPAPKHRLPRHNAPKFDLHRHLYRVSGVDLTQIDGINTLTAINVLGEIGMDMSRWPTEKHFGAWLRLAPGIRKSGGRDLKKRRRLTASGRVATSLRIAAQALHGSQSALGAFYRRKRGQIGVEKAIKAAAHRLAILIYRCLRYGMKYIDIGEKHYHERNRDKALKSLKRTARKLGFNIIPNKELELLQSGSP